VEHLRGDKYKLRFDLYELLHFTTAQMRLYTLSGELKANGFKRAENIYLLSTRFHKWIIIHIYKIYTF